MGGLIISFIIMNIEHRNGYLRFDKPILSTFEQLNL